MKKWFVLAGLAVAGCSGMGSLPDRLSRENAEEVSELARSAQCNSASEAAAITRLPDLAAVLAGVAGFFFASGLPRLQLKPSPFGRLATVADPQGASFQIIQAV